MEIKAKLIEDLGKMFEEFLKIENITYERIRWELDNFVYPYIGSYLANGTLTKEEGIEIFHFCEIKLREIKERFEGI
jgi:hypothetical protein